MELVESVFERTEQWTHETVTIIGVLFSSWQQYDTFHRLVTPGGRPGSIDDFWILDSTQKSINTLIKKKLGEI